MAEDVSRSKEYDPQRIKITPEERRHLVEHLGWLLSERERPNASVDVENALTERIDWVLKAARLTPDDKDHRRKNTFSAFQRAVFRSLLLDCAAFDHPRQREAERLMIRLLRATRHLQAWQDTPGDDVAWTQTLISQRSTGERRYLTRQTGLALEDDMRRLLARLMLGHADALRRIGEFLRAQHLEDAVDLRFERRPSPPLLRLAAVERVRLERQGADAARLAHLITALDRARARIDARNVVDVVERAWARAEEVDPDIEKVDGAFVDVLLEFAARVGAARAAREAGFVFVDMKSSPLILTLVHEPSGLRFVVGDHQLVREEGFDDPYEVHAERMGLRVNRKQPDVVMFFAHRDGDVERRCWLLGDAKRYEESASGEGLRAATLYQSVFAALLNLKRRWPSDQRNCLQAGAIRPHFTLWFLRETFDLRRDNPTLTALRACGGDSFDWTCDAPPLVDALPPIIAFGIEGGLASEEGSFLLRGWFRALAAQARLHLTGPAE